MSVLTGTIQLRKDTEANWTSSNPTLLNGEVAVSTDSKYVQTNQPRFKIGNGTDAWSALDYQPIDSQLTAKVVNGTSTNLLKSEYKVVKVISAQGQRLQIDFAQANNDPNSKDTIGIVAENINNNQEGHIMLYGQLLSINTTGSLQGETWADGDMLYLSATVAGGITNVKPTAPNHGVILGYVEYAHQNNGKIFVKIDNGYELGELHDVYVPSPVNNDTIVWSSGSTRYENKPLTGYALMVNCSTIAPVDATTYYAGGSYSVAFNTSLTNINRVIVPKTGNIKAIVVNWNANVGASTESSTIYVTVNTTDYTISSSVVFGTSLFQTNNLSMNIPVTAGDYITFKWITPTWVTNPTTCRINAAIYIE